MARAAEEESPTERRNYDSQANENFAKNLKGHLLLMHGTMDDNVPPNNTLLVVDALIKANKDFDLLMIPNAKHGYEAATSVRYAAALGLLRALPRRWRSAGGVPDEAVGRAAGGAGGSRRTIA